MKRGVGDDAGSLPMSGPISVSKPAEQTVDFAATNAARLQDALLGGKDNYQSDRDVVRRLLSVAPGFDRTVSEQCAMAERMVRFLADRAGVRQFLDCGSGMPLEEVNTHQVVQRFNNEARVVYIDNDPFVTSHGLALLEENEYSHFADADFGDPARVFGHPAVRRFLDVDQPVGLLFISSLQYLDDDTAAAALRTYREALAPGSFLLVTHPFDPADGGPASQLAARVPEFFGDRATDLGMANFRTEAQLNALFDGWEILRPGLVAPDKWWPEGPRLEPVPVTNGIVRGALAMKP